MPRCFWCNDDPLYMAYHDEGVGCAAARSRRAVRTSAAGGLPGRIVLDHRAEEARALPQVLFGFDVQRVAQMSDAEIDELMLDPGIIRNRAKRSTLRGRTRQAWLELDDPAGFLWSFVGGQPKINPFRRSRRGAGDYPGSRGHEQGAAQEPASTSSGRPSATPSCGPAAWSWTIPRTATVTPNSSASRALP